MANPFNFQYHLLIRCILAKQLEPTKEQLIELYSAFIKDSKKYLNDRCIIQHYSVPEDIRSD